MTSGKNNMMTGFQLLTETELECVSGGATRKQAYDAGKVTGEFFKAVINGVQAAIDFCSYVPFC